MRDESVGSVVITEDDTLLGIITVDDLNELLSDEHEQLATVLQEQRPAY